ncbi:MAG TPA: hypothetical protein VMC48_05650 [Methanobacterium sp.]|nr:hypothetical protein [Methanobacterium sp.]
MVLLVTISLVMNSAAATLNVIIITDPTGKDPNGAAAGSMSFADNMFQSTFVYSPDDHFAVLSGGSDENETSRLAAIVETINRMKNNETPAQAVGAASAYKGIRIMTGGPTVGAAVGGDFDAYLVTVAGDGTITVTPYSSGTVVLPAGTKGAIIHLRHTDGNPIGGNVSAVRQATAVMIGEQIRDGYSATEIMGNVFQKVAIESGEKYGGGAVNLVSDITTGDAFTPSQVNTKGFPMDQPYNKYDPVCGWAVAYPAAESYTTCPVDGNPLKISYGYQVLKQAITVSPTNATVYVYGTDLAGISTTTSDIVTYSVSKNGFNANTIAAAINSGIDHGLLIGVNHVEPKDINIKQNTKEVGVYFTPLSGGRTTPTWDLPISSSLLDIIGNLQTAIGLVLVVLVLFRSTLISSFMRKRR